MANFETLESAQAEIIRLNEELTALTTERDTLSQDNETLSQNNEELRKLNQQYFNKLSQQIFSQKNDTHEETKEVLSCEEFAKTLDI